MSFIDYLHRIDSAKKLQWGITFPFLAPILFLVNQYIEVRDLPGELAFLYCVAVALLMLGMHHVLRLLLMRVVAERYITLAGMALMLLSIPLVYLFAATHS